MENSVYDVESLGIRENIGLKGVKLIELLTFSTEFSTALFNNRNNTNGIINGYISVKNKKCFFDFGR